MANRTSATLHEALPAAPHEALLAAPAAQLAPPLPPAVDVLDVERGALLLGLERDRGRARDHVALAAVDAAPDALHFFRGLDARLQKKKSRTQHNGEMT